MDDVFCDAVADEIIVHPRISSVLVCVPSVTPSTELQSPSLKQMDIACMMFRAVQMDG